MIKHSDHTTIQICNFIKIFYYRQCLLILSKSIFETFSHFELYSFKYTYFSIKLYIKNTVYIEYSHIKSIDNDGIHFSFKDLSLVSQNIFPGTFYKLKHIYYFENVTLKKSIRHYIDLRYNFPETTFVMCSAPCVTSKGYATFVFDTNKKAKIGLFSIFLN